MKKKIAIVFNRMIVGGAEKALSNFLDALDKEKYDITLFTLDDKGAYFDEIPNGVEIKFTQFADSKKYFWDCVKTFKIFKVLNALYCRCMIRLCRDEYKKFLYTMRIYPKFQEKFDCAIAYKMNYDNTATVITRINADKKCAFMHSDSDQVKKKKGKFISLLFKYLDMIFCVSEECRNALNTTYPTYKNNTEVMHNQVPSRQIINLSNYDIQPLAHIALLTVGRLSSEKGQQMIPAAARMLLDAGYDIHWYLVGDGPLREEVEREIEKYGVSDRVILLGTQSNPYPYIKNCDIYVQPSFSEGYCTTTVEAKILQKPIVTTDAPGMREQFVSGENGLIVDAMTPEALFDGIKKLIDHPVMSEKFVENLKNEVYDNSKELQKLYDFIERLTVKSQAQK